MDRNNPGREEAIRYCIGLGTERKHTKRGEAKGVRVACRQLIECH